MKILWMSHSPWATTGYGTQTKFFTPLLRRSLGHELTLFSFGLEAGSLEFEGMRVLPRAIDPFGRDIAAAHAKTVGAEIVISFLDIWVFNQQLASVRWCPWFPVDSAPLAPGITNALRSAYQPIVYSRFGERVVQEAGFDPLYVPHGIPTDVFCPGDKAEARRRVNLPEDAFIVGLVAANKGWPARKAFQEQLAAVAEARRRGCKDLVIYIHALKGENGEYHGVNLPALCAGLGLREGHEVFYAEQYPLWIGYNDGWICDLYRSFDVLTSVSYGEGFGLPILEAQSCGCPVITGAWTSMGEITFGGWQLEEGEAEKFWTPLMTYQWRPRIEAITERYLTAYKYARRDDVRAKAREGALAYDVRRVVQEWWRPALEAIERRVRDISGTIDGLREKWRSVA